LGAEAVRIRAAYADLRAGNAFVRTLRKIVGFAIIPIDDVREGRGGSRGNVRGECGESDEVKAADLHCRREGQ
jgi:hypothetical protein